jgi:hypothetical protein
MRPSGTTNCPLGFTEVIADFIIILRLRFRCRRQMKFEFDRRLNINTEQGFGCMTEGETAEKREVVNV